MKSNGILNLLTKKSLALIFIILVFCSGCNNALTYETQISNVSESIVSAFDNKDKELLKSLLHDEVINSNPDLDEQIEKAFDIYKGKSVSYNNSGFSAKEIIDNKVHKVEYAQLTVETDKEIYIIDYSFNIKDEAHPDREGIYTIKLLPNSIFDEYAQYGLENDPNQAIDEEPFEMRWGGGVEDYKKYGLGVFAYTRKDIIEAYYKKNGKPMPIAESCE